MNCTANFLSNEKEDNKNNDCSGNDIFYNVNLSVHKLFHPRHSAPSHFNEERKYRAVKRRRCTISCAEDNNNKNFIDRNENNNRNIFQSGMSTNDPMLNKKFQRGINYYNDLSKNCILRTTSDAFNFNLNTSITKRKKPNIYNWEVYRCSPPKEKYITQVSLYNRNVLRKSVEETINRSVAARSFIKTNLHNNRINNNNDNNINIIEKNDSNQILDNQILDNQILDNQIMDSHILDTEGGELYRTHYLNKNKYYLNRISEGSSNLGLLNEAQIDIRNDILKKTKPLNETYIMSNATQSDNCFKNKNDFRESLKTQRDTENVFVNSESTISSFLLEREKQDLSKLHESKNAQTYLERCNNRDANEKNLLRAEIQYNANLLGNTIFSNDFMNVNNKDRMLIEREREREEMKNILRSEKLIDSRIENLQVKKRHTIHIPNYAADTGFTDRQYYPINKIRNSHINKNVLKEEDVEEIEDEKEEEEKEEDEDEDEDEEEYVEKKKIRRHSDAIHYEYASKHKKTFNNSKSVNNFPNDNLYKNSVSNAKVDFNTNTNTNTSTNFNDPSNYFNNFSHVDMLNVDPLEQLIHNMDVESSLLNEINNKEIETVKKMKLFDKKRKRGEGNNNNFHVDREGIMYDNFGRKIKQEKLETRREPFSEKNGEDYIFSKNYFSDILTCLHNKALIEVICKLKESAKSVIGRSLFRKIEESARDREDRYPADFFFLYRHLGEVVDDIEYMKHLKKERNESCYLDVPFPNLREIMNLEPVQTFDETDDSDEYHEVEVKLLENYYCKSKGLKPKHVDIFEENKITEANIVVKDKMVLEKMELEKMELEKMELEKMEIKSQLNPQLPSQLSSQSLALSNSPTYLFGLVRNKIELKKNEKEMREREEKLIQFMQKIKQDKDEFYNSISNEQNFSKIQNTVLTTNENFILSGHLFNIHFSPKYGPVVYLLKCEDDKYYYRTIEISRNLESRVRELQEGKREYYRKGKKDLNGQNKNLCVLFTESDIKNVLYVPMSCGWSHYGYFKDQCNVLFFRRPKKG